MSAFARDPRLTVGGRSTAARCSGEDGRMAIETARESEHGWFDVLEAPA